VKKKITSIGRHLHKYRKDYLMGMGASGSLYGAHATHKILRHNKEASEILQGGKADHVPDSAIDKKELKKGMRHEAEHTKNKKIQKEIAKDHLVEDPKYYEHLARVEKMAFARGFEKVALHLTKKHKDPEGGLTSAGRSAYNKATGSRLKPGVKGKADTPEKMRRKGSWAVRFYGRSGELPPLKKPNGEPTRFALTAAAWGEPVPETVSEAKAIAQKGRELLEKYKKSKERG
jgi:hypothetical protein